jgi:hypothetical protein
VLSENSLLSIIRIKKIFHLNLLHHKMFYLKVVILPPARLNRRQAKAKLLVKLFKIHKEITKKANNMPNNYE